MWPGGPGTSFTTIRINGVDSIYGESGTQLQAPTDVGSANVSSWRISDTEVTQRLEIALNPQTGREDTAKISYTVRNVGSADQTVGTRVMIDTELNYNDGAPFRVPGDGIITNEKEYLGSAMPDSFQAFFGLDDSTHVAASTLKGGDATPPDRLVLASWPRIEQTLYEYAPDANVSFGESGSHDSAYAVYWNSQPLAPGASRTYVTYYGLSALNVDLRPPLALGVSGPATLTVAGNTYTPNPFDITATVFNNGTAAATNVQLTLNLTGTAGLTLEQGDATQLLGTLDVGTERQVTWQVRAAPQGQITTIGYAVVAEATNTAPKTVVREVTVPKHAGVPPPYTRSWYVSSPNDAPNQQLGCQARERGERGVMILVFGSPRELGVDAQGQPIYGTQLLADRLRRQINVDDVANIVEDFARGYARGCTSTPPSTATGLLVVVGTTNSKVGGIDNPALTAAHGAAWARMINNLNTGMLNDYGGAVVAVGGYDAEQGVLDWSSPGPTLAWAQGYSSAANYIYYNFGDATAAPRHEPRNEWTDGPVTARSFPHIPALDLAFKLSDGLPFARSLPQIYKAEFAYEWYNVKRYAQEQGENMFIDGVVTSCGPTACDFADDASWMTKLGTNAFLTPNQGWYALYETINAPFTPEENSNGQSLQVPNPLQQRSLPFVTDFANGVRR